MRVPGRDNGEKKKKKKSDAVIVCRNRSGIVALSKFQFHECVFQEDLVSVTEVNVNDDLSNWLEG